MTFKAAFIFIAPGVDSKKNNHEFVSEGISLTCVGVSTYEEAVSISKELIAGGVGAIELCAGFGNQGVAMVKQAVGNNINVGVVRFDNHFAFGNKSGDDFFIKN